MAEKQTTWSWVPG